MKGCRAHAEPYGYHPFGVLLLVQSFLPTAAAAIVTLAYRGITFWLPLLYGMVAFRLVGRSSESYSA